MRLFVAGGIALSVAGCATTGAGIQYAQVDIVARNYAFAVPEILQPGRTRWMVAAFHDFRIPNLKD